MRLVSSPPPPRLRFVSQLNLYHCIITRAAAHCINYLRVALGQGDSPVPVEGVRPVWSGLVWQWLFPSQSIITYTPLAGPSVSAHTYHLSHYVISARPPPVPDLLRPRPCMYVALPSALCPVSSDCEGDAGYERARIHTHTHTVASTRPIEAVEWQH